MTQKPRLSVIVVAYRMPRQALNTVYSLSCKYQQNVDENDYEIIVVENASTEVIDIRELEKLGNNIRYLQRQESGHSPAAAINAGFALCRGDYAGLLIDGARMVTPRVISLALQARTIDRHSLLAVPGYNLGSEKQHLDTSYNEEKEQQLLKQCQWQNNGYRLFDIANIGESNPRGFFQPFMENNCLFTAYENFERIGFADEDFHYPGGGGLNLHMFRRLGTLPAARYFFVTPGEGSFHQYHGGVSTTPREDREALLVPPREQLVSYWGGQEFKALQREPFLLGSVNSHAQKFLLYSSERASKRFERKTRNSEAFWPSDMKYPRYTEQFS